MTRKKKWSVRLTAEHLAFVLVLQKQVKKEEKDAQEANKRLTRLSRGVPKANNLKCAFRQDGLRKAPQTLRQGQEGSRECHALYTMALSAADWVTCPGPCLLGNISKVGIKLPCFRMRACLNNAAAVLGFDQLWR